jgi:hypothetical protein
MTAGLPIALALACLSVIDMIRPSIFFQEGAPRVDVDPYKVTISQFTDSNLLRPGTELGGPGTIESRVTTVVVNPGDRAAWMNIATSEST